MSCCWHLQTKLKSTATILKYYRGIPLLNIKHLKYVLKGVLRAGFDLELLCLQISVWSMQKETQQVGEHGKRPEEMHLP